jgi:hypothetical protein
MKTAKKMRLNAKQTIALDATLVDAIEEMGINVQLIL